MIGTLFVLSLLGGFSSGLLGVGGAILLIPLLLAVPPLIGVGNLSMHEVSGVTMFQVLAASATGCWSHRRSGFAHTRTILTIGIPMGVFSFIGATVSKSLTNQTMLLIFGGMVTLAFPMLLKRSPGESDGGTEFEFNTLLAAGCGSCVGLLAGIVGAGGGFILIPVMLRVLKMPIRVAVGSSLGILFIGAIMGSVGKLLTLQVEWIYLLPIIAGSLPSSMLGAHVSRKISPSRIRHVMLILFLLILIKTWYDIFKVFTAGG